MMYLDLANEFCLTSVREYLHALIENAHFVMPDNAVDADKWIEFIQYNLGQWFHPNNVHFLGKNSNYWTDILGGNPILTNNGSEALNSALNKEFPSGGYISKATAVKGLHEFFTVKNRHFVTFVNDGKWRKRDKKMMNKFCKFRRLGLFLEHFTSMYYYDAGLCKQALMEVVFKFGNINDMDVNRNWERLSNWVSLFEL